MTEWQRWRPVLFTALAGAVFGFYAMHAWGQDLDPKAKVQGGGAHVQPYFSPKGGAQEALVEQIAASKSTIRVASYYFNSLNLMDALIAAKKRGVDVQAVLDRSQPNQQCCGKQLIEARIPVCYDYSHKIMHSKYMIFDGKVVATGSYNHTGAAEWKNAENLLIVRSVSLASQYEADWKAHKAHCK